MAAAGFAPTDEEAFLARVCLSSRSRGGRLEPVGWSLKSATVRLMVAHMAQEREDTWVIIS